MLQYLVGMELLIVSADDECVSHLFNNISKGTVINTDIDFYRAVANDVKILQ